MVREKSPYDKTSFISLILKKPCSCYLLDLAFRGRLGARYFFMGYAIIETGGKQYRVTEGEKIRIEKLPYAVAGSITFDKILMLGGNGNRKIGTPYVTGATVTGKVLEQGKAKKIIVFKFKRRKKYQKKRGHRQLFSTVLIEKVNDGA